VSGDIGLRLRPLSEAEPRNVRWLVVGLIPLRTLTLVAGVGGLGKSMWLSGIAARLSRGELDGHPAGDTVIVSYEDTAEEVLRPRVEAAGGDPARVHVIVPEHRDYVDPVALPRDIVAVEQLVLSVEAKLLVIDPIVAGIAVELDAHKDQHVRVVLARLAELAEEADCAVAMVGHLNKASSTDAYIRVANSVAFWNAARSVVLVTEDNGNDDDLRLVAQRKANYAKVRPVERWRVESIVLEHLIDPVDGRPIETARMVFLEFADDVDSADVLVRRGDSDDKTANAVNFLMAMLADGGWHESARLKELAGAAGISERTLQRAAQSQNVEVDRRGVPPASWWRLPDISLAGAFGCLNAPSPYAPPLSPTVGAFGDSASSSGFPAFEPPNAPTRQAGMDEAPPLPGDASNEAAILADAQAMVDAGQARWIDDEPAPPAADGDEPTLCGICRAPAPTGYCTDHAACNYRARRRLGIPARVCDELLARERRQAT
jgi:hypothetical protein